MTALDSRRCKRFGNLAALAMSLVLASCARTWADRDFKKEYPSCSEPLKVETVGDGWFGVSRGCGEVQFRLLKTKGDPYGGGDLVTKVVQRYNFETQCPVEQLSFKRLEGYTFGISGCGYSAVYKHLPYAGWVTDSATHPAH